MSDFSLLCHCFMTRFFLSWFPYSLFKSRWFSWMSYFCSYLAHIVCANDNLFLSFFSCFLYVNACFFFNMPLFYNKVFLSWFLYSLFKSSWFSWMSLIEKVIFLKFSNLAYIICTIDNLFLLCFFSPVFHCFMTRFSFLDFVILCVNQGELVRC